MFKFEAKLALSLGHYPHVGLVAIVHGVRVGIPRRQAVVNWKYGHVNPGWPLASVALVTRWVLANEATPMEMNDRFSDREGRLPNHVALVKVNVIQRVRAQKPYHDLCWAIKLRNVCMVFVCLWRPTQIDLLRVFHKLSQHFISQIVVTCWLFHVKLLGQHRYK